MAYYTLPPKYKGARVGRVATQLANNLVPRCKRITTFMRVDLCIVIFADFTVVTSPARIAHTAEPIIGILLDFAG